MAEEHSHARRLRVLHVEDDIAQTKMLERTIGDAVSLYAVQNVQDGISFLSKKSGQQLDAILLDLGLPEESELSAVTKLRAVTDIPIVILTGNTDPNDSMAERSLELGANFWLEKGSKGVEIVRAIRLEIVRHRLARMAPKKDNDV